MGLDVLQSAAFRMNKRLERAHLVYDHVVHILGGDLHIPPTETHEVGKPRMGADRHATAPDGRRDRAHVRERRREVLEIDRPICDEQELGERELTAFCSQRLVAYKTPRRIYRLRQLPRNAMGKIQRVALLDMVVAHHKSPAGFR